MKRMILAAGIGLSLLACSEATSEPASKEAQVQKVLDGYYNKYQEVIENFSRSMGQPSTREPVQKEIEDACATGSDGFPEDDNETAMAAMFLTPVLVEHGFSWTEFANDSADANVQIKKIVGC